MHTTTALVRTRAWTFGLSVIPLALAFLVPRKRNEARQEDTVLDADALGPAAE